MKSEALTAHVGVSAPETPKYLLLNNFLADFFEARKHEEDCYTFDFFCDKEIGILVCQESDSEAEEELKRSFDEFLFCFTGRELLSGIRSGKDKIYMPLSLDMLGSANINLRHLLYNLVFSDEKQKALSIVQVREELQDYLYKDSTGIYNIVSKFSGIGKAGGIKDNVPLNFEDLKKERFFRNLGSQFNRDLHILLTHRHFRGQDFYKRLDDLAVLLTMYVVLFFIRRVTKSIEPPILLCKGSTDSGLNDSGWHRACISNYKSFREHFSNLLSEFYVGRVKLQNKDENKEIKEEYESDNETVDKTTGKVIRVYNKQGVIYVGNKTLKMYANEVFDGNYRDDSKLNQKAETVFRLEDGQGQDLTPEEFVEYYLQLTGKISGTNQKRIFNVLQSSGKEIGFVHPPSRSKFKYFAMSGELTAFLVRLYLSQKDLEYAFFEDFVQSLEKDYGIYIRKDKKSEKLLAKYGIRVTQQEVSRNEQAFLNTLDHVNCLVRLSDSGYVVTLPEKKGDFRLL